MKFLKYYRITITLLILLVFNNCTSPISYYKGDKAYLKISNQNQLLQDNLTIDAKKFLNTREIYKQFNKNPNQTIKDTINKYNRSFHLETIDFNYQIKLKIIAELCIYSAKNTKKEDAIKYWLTACIYSYKFLFEHSNNENNTLQLSPDIGTVITYYNYSLIKIFTYLQERNYINKSNYNISSVTGDVNFTIPNNKLPWKIDTFKKFLIGYNYETDNFNTGSTRVGIGIPLGGIPSDNNYFPKLDKQVKVVKYMYPSTFIIKFNLKNKIIKATPCYYDFYKYPYIDIKNQKAITPNAFTVFMGKFLKNYPHSSNINYFFSPEKMIKEKMGIYMLTPYDKAKIPVLFIHGLISDPQSFAQILNTLMQSQTIREKYQFWFYYYPTGQPLVLSAESLRSNLDEINKNFNNNDKSSKFNDMVIIGYSQGGLLAQLCIQDSDGDYFKNKVIENNKKTENEINGNIEQHKMLDNILVFTPLPYVKQTIFLSTPHKGAKMASWLAFQLIADLMVTSPENYNRNLNFLTNLSSTYNDQIINSNALYNLMPKSSFINIVQTLPYSKNVKIHSIIGDKNGPDNPTGFDGIITYDSAHLDNSSNEVIIKSDHHSIVVPICAREILKILLNSLKNNTNMQ